jgi:hypothetical protein
MIAASSTYTADSTLHPRSLQASTIASSRPLRHHLIPTLPPGHEHPRALRPLCRTGTPGRLLTPALTHHQALPPATQRDFEGLTVDRGDLRYQSQLQMLEDRTCIAHGEHRELANETEHLKLYSAT